MYFLIKTHYFNKIILIQGNIIQNEFKNMKLENDLAKFGCNIVNLPSDKVILHHPSSEDLMLMINLMNLLVLRKVCYQEQLTGKNY